MRTYENNEMNFKYNAAKHLKLFIHHTSFIPSFQHLTFSTSLSIQIELSNAFKKSQFFINIYKVHTTSL